MDVHSQASGCSFMVLAISAVTGDASFESEVDTAAALLSASSQSCLFFPFFPFFFGREGYSLHKCND